MTARLWIAGWLALLSGCAGGPARIAAPVQPVSVQIIAFNDFHGNLLPPKQSIEAPAAGGGTVRVPAGGAAYLASAVERMRAANPNSVVVAAGDLIGASPLVSALFLDEPAIEALNLIGLDYTALGNHEFDKGRAELLRMAHGGCDKFTPREPCQLDPRFGGARFGFLAANTITDDGRTLFPPYAIRSFGRGRAQVRVAFIGLTLREAPTIVTPAGVAGLSFRDEADSANALVPELRRAGADAIVVLIHQGGHTDVGYDDKSCAGLDGDLLPILDRLDPAIDVVVSGHTHRAYVCDYARTNPAKPFLLTSAGQYGTLLTSITLQIDPATHRVTAKQADNVIVQSEAYTGSSGPVPLTDQYPRYAPAPPVAALVSLYADAAAPRAARPIGRMTGPATRDEAPSHESVLGNLIADASLAATRGATTGRAQIAFSNAGGLRADLVPGADGTVTFGQLFATQPFGNTLTVKTFTGRQIRDILEQQFSGRHSVAMPYVLPAAATLRYSYDLSRPEGSRVRDIRVDGVPLDDAASYRVTMNSFLASGGDGFTTFQAGTDPLGGAQDIDALEAYFAAGPITPPATDRIRNATP